MYKQEKPKKDIKSAQFKVFSDATYINPIPMILYGFINTIAEHNPKNVIFYMDMYDGILFNEEKSEGIRFDIDEPYKEWHPACISVINPELFDKIKVGIDVRVTGFFYATHKIKTLDTGNVYTCHIAEADSIEVLKFEEE